MTKRNPKWTRDELILALDLYFTTTFSNSLDESDPGIIEISRHLKKMASFLNMQINENYRSADAVYMKLMNFRHIDPNVTEKGLAAVSKLDVAIWNEFSEKQKECSRIADLIKMHLERETTYKFTTAEEESEAKEGRLLTRVHCVRERNPSIVKKAKDAFLKKHSKLYCEACGFNPEEKYGDLKNSIIECHHTKPVSSLMPNEKTKVSDLVMLCPNCHRAIHASKPWLTTSQLESILR